MPDSVTRRHNGLFALVLVASLVVGAPAASADETRTAGPVRLEADAGTTFELDDGRRFLDTLELRTAPDGSVVLVNELRMADYLAGVSEMPPRWPGEALKAQAVAARTYAWRSVLRGTFRRRGLGYDICGTVACQVFTGTAVVEESSWGGRWRAAVEETADEVLLDADGRPILARYFSTSGGRTLPNEVAFPESGPLPYLVGVDDPDDAIAPLHRWRVEFTRAEFDDVLSRGQTLAASVPVADVERRGALVDPHADVVVVGEDGTETAVPAVRFREFVSRVAADRHPDRFPGPRPDGGTLPTTLPSSRFEIDVVDDAVVIEGRGWGHGVGMGQYGARAKALRGMGYEEILAEYYNGLRPRAHGEVPDRVRVGLDVDDGVTVRADTTFRVVAGGDEVAGRALGTWRVERVPEGFRLVAPESRSAALDVSPTTRATTLATDGSDRVVVEADVNKPVELSLRVLDVTGETVLERDLGVAEPGTHAATWRYQDADGERVDAGDYRLLLLGVDEQEAHGGTSVGVEVPPPRAADSATEPSGAAAWLRGWAGTGAAAVVGLVVAAGLVTAARRRRSP